MSLRSTYNLLAIRSEIENFEALIDAELFDDAVKYFRQHLEKPTLFGLETSLFRANLLKKINVEELSNDSDKCFVLYSLALTLNLTGGYPNKAIPLYEKHNELAERIGDHGSLSQCLGHHAKALRQVGRFFESELYARKGLKLIREKGDFLREAVNLYWLGMGLAHRGEADLSEIALQRSLRIFRAKFATQSEGVVNAFLAQRALWLEDYENAIIYADKAFTVGSELEADENHADLHGAVKILIAGARMKGEALISKGNCTVGERFLHIALERARQIEFVEEELPALRSLALNSLQQNALDAAGDYLNQSWNLAERGDFLLYNADSYNILAKIEIAAGNRLEAINAAQKAFDLSICDGKPFAYARGLNDAISLLKHLHTTVPSVPTCTAALADAISEDEINPADEFRV